MQQARKKVKTTSLVDALSLSHSLPFPYRNLFYILCYCQALIRCSYWYILYRILVDSSKTTTTVQSKALTSPSLRNFATCKRHTSCRVERLLSLSTKMEYNQAKQHKRRRKQGICIVGKRFSSMTSLHFLLAARGRRDDHHSSQTSGHNSTCTCTSTRYYSIQYLLFCTAT